MLESLKSRSEARAYLAGYFLGDGWSQPDRRAVSYCQVTLVGNEQDRPRIEKAAVILGWPLAFRKTRSGTWTLNVPAWERAFLTDLGIGLEQGAWTKAFDTDEVVRLPRDLQEWFVAGMWDADGTARAYRIKGKYLARILSYTSVSRRLIEGLAKVLEVWGLQPKFEKVIRTKPNGNKSFHLLWLNKKDALRFRELVTLQPKKQLQLEQF